VLCRDFVIGPSSSFQFCTRLADRTFNPLCNVAFGSIATEMDCAQNFRFTP
jgi:hypothetical protein